MALQGSDSEKLAQLAQRPYAEQAKWFMNAFWEQFASAQAEKIWAYVHAMHDLDTDKKAEGNALDELQAHRLIEKFNETLTVQAMRDKLRSTGAITTNIRYVPLVHLLVFKYNADWRFLVNAPQGDKEEIAKAQALLDEVQAAFEASEARAAEAAAALREAQAEEAAAKRAEAEAKRSEADAKAREAEAKAREAEARDREAEAIAREEEARIQEAPFKAAQEEVDAALADVKAQEDFRNARTEELKLKSTQGGVVQQNKAKNELAQHLAEDPLPLRKAKITLEAALKKAEKARAPFEAALKQAQEARAVAEQAANEASASARRAEQAQRAADAAVDAARQRLEEAEAYLEEVKARIPHGTVWWMERELHEKRKYMPTSKGGIAK